MVKTTIKTVTFLMKCLRVDIPLFKDVYGVSVPVNRVYLYKTSLIEIISLVNYQELHIKITKEQAEAIIKAIDEEAKLKKQLEANLALAKSIRPATPVVQTQEPGYTLVHEEDAVTEQVSAV